MKFIRKLSELNKILIKLNKILIYYCALNEFLRNVFERFRFFVANCKWMRGRLQAVLRFVASTNFFIKFFIFSIFFSSLFFHCENFLVCGKIFLQILRFHNFTIEYLTIPCTAKRFSAFAQTNKFPTNLDGDADGPPAAKNRPTEIRRIEIRRRCSNIL